MLLAPNCILNLCEESVNGADAIIEPKFTDSAYLNKGANSDLGLDGGDGGGAAPLLPVLCAKRNRMKQWRPTNGDERKKKTNTT